MPVMGLVADYDAEVIQKWNTLLLDIDRYSPSYRPAPTSRVLAYLGLAAYEACTSRMPDHASLSNHLTGLHIPAAETEFDYHWPTVVHHTYSTLVHRFFPIMFNTTYGKALDLEKDLDEKYSSETDEDVFERSKAYGIAVADAVWEWSKLDTVGHVAHLYNYGTYDWSAHFVSDGDWVPTSSPTEKPLFPTWGEARTFVLQSQELICKEPLSYSDTLSAMYAEALEVYNAINDDNWANGQWMAFFWSDDIPNLTCGPSSRWLSIAHQVINKENATLDVAVLCYAKLGLALNDATVASWKSKYHYNRESPESYIQRVIDTDWQPRLSNPITGEVGITPSFPAYPSEHAAMGWAAAEVLTSMFGTSYSLLESSHLGRTEFNSSPRYFHNFYEMANENALSRIPLGVNWRMDCNAGTEVGQLCGRRVNELTW